MTMRQLGFVRGSLLALFPLGAFFVGPALAAFAPVGVEERALMSAMPTTLPLIALGVTAVLAFRWTRSAGAAGLLTAGALFIVLVGVFAFVAVTFPYGH
jgi:cyanate permease